MRIFVYEGIIIGLSGTILGVMGGLAACAILDRYQIKLPGDVYPISSLPVKVLPSPVEFPRMMYYQLWHERTHASKAGRWLREQIKTVAASLRSPQQEAAA